MKRLSLLSCLALLALPALPAAALASGAVPLETASRLPGPSRLALPAQPAPVGPLRASTGASIHGTVTYGMSFWPVAAELTWLVPGDAGDYASAATATDESGAYAFSGVAAADGSGQLWVTPDPDDGSWQRGRYDMSWADGQDLTVDWRPGYVECGGQRGSPWPDWKHGSVTIWTQPGDANGTGISATSFTDAPADGEPWHTTVSVEPGTGLSAVVYFWMNQGMEVPFSGTVEASKSSSTQLVADQFHAPYLETSLMSHWDSGKPGQRVFFNLERLPLGWIEQFRGRSDYPGAGAWTNITRLTVKSQDITTSIRIPLNARPGYFYWVALDHIGGALHLQVPYQVCSLRPSRTSVAPGGTVRLSGVVPVQGHWGSTPGIRKSVAIYACPMRNAGQPAYWTPPTSQRWRLVATARTDRYGKFVSAPIRLKKTSTFVVRYPGDRWYWRGFTSPVSVIVN